jgi:nicotinate-nucleotide--dimethylbenzimidazole phosphoribosyltransferase
MVRNFVRGGAAINVLCGRFGIEPTIVDMGVNAPAEPGTLDRKIACGAANWLRGAAMTREQAICSIEIGIGLACEADVFGAGEMGIGNTTTAAALLCGFAGIDPALAVGRGTGVSGAQLANKAEVVRRGLVLHNPDPGDPIGVLAAVGGFEIGGICGFLLGAAARRTPVAVDGFIACSACLIAQALAPQIDGYLFYSHRSAESGHARMLEFLGAEPLLSLEMRLGEGTGAALAINLLESAVTLYREMATFSEASISTSEHPR